jgi:hypothetical protein
LWEDAQHAKESGGYALLPDKLGTAAAGEINAVRASGASYIEIRIAVTHTLELSPVWLVLIREAPSDCQAVTTIASRSESGVRQRTEEDGIDDAVNGGVRANAET